MGKGGFFDKAGKADDMNVQCAWCGKDIGRKEPLEDTETTHGICPDCYRTVSRRPVHLSGRLMDVLELAVRGRPNQEIADSLNIKPSTVKNHLTRILLITGCLNRAQLTFHYWTKQLHFERRKDHAENKTQQ
jgi:DNA-binding CsgD family transcriptional regulator